MPDARRSAVMHGTSHCDFEGPTNRFCEALCGRATPALQQRIRDETVAAAVELLVEAAARPATEPEAPSREKAP